jgi:uncharacterized protein involved in outer membrane biogenesis
VKRPQFGIAPVGPVASYATSGAHGLSAHKRRVLWVALLLSAALIAFLVAFDWNVLREPVQRFASRTTGREVTIGHLQVKVSTSPTIVLSDVTVGGIKGSDAKQVARAERIEFSVLLRSLLTRDIVIPHLRLTNADIELIRTADGRGNWMPSRDEGTASRSVTLRALTLEDTKIAYHDAKLDIGAYLRSNHREDGIYSTRLSLSGHWRKTKFTGIADTAGNISLHGSADPFPIRLTLNVGQTSIAAEGRVADITRFQQIDTTFSIRGPSLASLYPTLRLALPETPPYRFTGHLRRDDDHYTYQNFSGKIGNTDISGDAQYEIREPRPFLTAKLRSRRFDLADLGPLLGFEPRTSSGSENSPAVLSAARAAATKPSGRVLPQKDLNRQKLNAMDAAVQLTAVSLQIPEQIPLENFTTRIDLVDGVLKLDPINFGFAGGNIVSAVTLDARNDPIAGKLALDLKRVRLAELFPTVERMNQSGGRIGAQLRLTGRGNSIAELLASSDGNLTAGMAGGRISEFTVWLVNLQGGELLRLVVGGDRQTRIRCGAFAMDVKGGIGAVESFIFDTEEARIDGKGKVDLRSERFNLVLRPEPKKPGILSLRGPVTIEGTFRDADVAIAPESIARGVGAVALGLVNPFLALLPLIEAGPGEDADCREVLAPVRGALRQSGQAMGDVPRARVKGERRSPAPIIDVPPIAAQRPAPIIDTR